MRIKHSASARDGTRADLAACASVAQPARADDAAFDGNWKLVVLPFGE